MSRQPVPLTLAAVLGVLISGAAQADSFLPAPDAARLLADGKPWNGIRGDGDHVRLTFNADGTGRFEGPISRSVTWSVQGDAVCVRIGFPLGAKCLRFRRSGASLQAFDGDAPDLLLTH